MRLGKQGTTEEGVGRPTERGQEVWPDETAGLLLRDQVQGGEGTWWRGYQRWVSYRVLTYPGVIAAVDFSLPCFLFPIEVRMIIFTM